MKPSSVARFTRLAHRAASYTPPRSGRSTPNAFLGEVSIVGVPMHLGQPIEGVDRGPSLLRQAGLHRKLGQIGWNVNEKGDVEITADRDNDPVLKQGQGLAKRSYAIGQNMQRLANMVTHGKQESGFVLVLGGDHTIAAGSIAGLLRDNPDLGIIWVDAHADLNTPTTSPSGNMHGMPLSFLIPGLIDHKTVPGFEWMEACAVLKPEQLVYIGLRDVDPGEILLIRDQNILTFTMHDIDRFGIGKVMDFAHAHLAGRKLHLSFDVDAMDPIVAPSTGTRVPGGLTYREAHYVAESIAMTGRLGSMDLVEVNPDLSRSIHDVGLTVDAAMDVIEAAMGVPNRVFHTPH